MSIPVSIADVLTQVAFRLHLPDFATGEFITPTQALFMVQSSASRLGGLMTRLYGDNYFVQTASLATQAGVELVSLPSGCTDVRAVYWVDAQGRAHRMQHAYTKDWQPKVLAWSTSGVGAADNYGDLYLSQVPTYRLEGQVLAFQPVPSAVYTVQIEYVSSITVTSVSDTIQGGTGWLEWLVLDMCEQIADREDKDPTRFTARKAQVEYDMKAQASGRDRLTPLQGSDVRGTGRWGDSRRSRWWY